MFFDLNKLENKCIIESDVCIVGAGAAGISIAREYINTNTSVTILESGNFDFEEKTNDLNHGTSSGQPYDTGTTRQRYFGGTTNHWTGWCAPLNELDFAKRSWVKHSGWPIDKKDIDPWYASAQKVLELGEFRYDSSLWKYAGAPEPELKDERLVSRFWQYSPPTRFGSKYREALKQSSNISVYLHANLDEFVVTENADSVKHARIRSLSGKTALVKARQYVLACGGLENPRLLLLSNSVMPSGLGNTHDLVGRFFMEHPEVISAGISVSDKDYFKPLSTSHPVLPSLVSDQKVRIRTGLCLSEQHQKTKQVLNSSITLHSDYSLKKEIDQPPGHSGTFEKLVSRIYKKVTGKRMDKRFTSDILYARTEQAPNPDSRVTLSDDYDALGQRKLNLDWRLSALDRHTIKETARIAGVELARLNVGRVKVFGWLEGDQQHWTKQLGTGFHHMGTTRMSNDPTEGVVDKNARVHGIDNLYVAGSSVFPTSGYANPTLTIVALSLRLADHLKKTLRT